MSSDIIAHIGVAVKDLDRSIEVYRLITGVEPSEIHEVPDQKVKVAFFAPPSGQPGRIELVAPTSEDSPVKKFLDKRGDGLHHLCVIVDDLNHHLEKLREAGVRLIDETPRTGAEGNRIAFVHPDSTGGVLIELQERAD